jgi:hypothetical protein
MTQWLLETQTGLKADKVPPRPSNPILNYLKKLLLTAVLAFTWQSPGTH